MAQFLSTRAQFPPAADDSFAIIASKFLFARNHRLATIEASCASYGLTSYSSRESAARKSGSLAAPAALSVRTRSRLETPLAPSAKRPVSVSGCLSPRSRSYRNLAISPAMKFCWNTLRARVTTSTTRRRTREICAPGRLGTPERSVTGPLIASKTQVKHETSGVIQ